MLLKKSITAEFKTEANKREYKLKYSEIEVLHGASVLNIIIRPSDADGHRKTALNQDMVSDETMLAGSITLVSNSKELIKDLPLEMLYYRPEGNNGLFINIDKFDLAASKITLPHIATSDVGKSIEITFIYS